MGKRFFNWMFCTGVIIIISLVVSYFIKIEVDSGNNFITLDSLLGIAIFHNPFILGLYLLIAIVLIFTGIRHERQIRKS